MRRPSITLLWPLALVALAGCITPDATMKSFIGKHSSEIVARWGPPQERMSDGQGGEVWSYFERRQWTTPGHADTRVYGTGSSYGSISGNPYGATYYGNSTFRGNATTTYTPPQNHGYTAHRTFFINADGIVYRYGWKGL